MSDVWYDRDYEMTDNLYFFFHLQQNHLIQNIGDGVDFYMKNPLEGTLHLIESLHNHFRIL